MTDCTNSKVELFEARFEHMLDMLVRDILNVFEFEAINRITLENVNMFICNFITESYYVHEYIIDAFTPYDLKSYCNKYDINLQEASKLVYIKDPDKITLLKDGILKYILQGMETAYGKNSIYRY